MRPVDLCCSAGRYLFLNAIANQLRYPNSHTNYFLNLILYLFAEANTPAIQEQITRSVGSWDEIQHCHGTNGFELQNPAKWECWLFHLLFQERERKFIKSK